MSDDLVKRVLKWVGSNHNQTEAIELMEAQAAEIAHLRAAIATARREGMEDAAKRLEALHKNHKYNPLTGEGSEHDVGYYRALAEGAAHILRAVAKEGK